VEEATKNTKSHGLVCKIADFGLSNDMAPGCPTAGLEQQFLKLLYCCFAADLLLIYCCLLPLYCWQAKCSRQYAARLTTPRPK
jgi:hypothetical protein